MTVVEVLLVVAVLAILAGLLIPALMKASPRRGGINCVSNLKQIGLAFRMWSNDDGDKFPWQVTVETNGTMELAESPSVFQHFAAISKGVLDLRDILFFLLTIGFWLYASAVVIDLKKAD